MRFDKTTMVTLKIQSDFLPNAVMKENLRPFITEYPIVILSNCDYKISFPWLSKSKIKIIPPAIDPLSQKNRPMNTETARQILEQFGINCAKPIITQVSRFDPWKDPLGVMRAYYIAKNTIPNLQLVLAGFLMAKDDPEAVSVFDQVKKHACSNPDIFLFADIKKLKTHLTIHLSALFIRQVI